MDLGVRARRRIGFLVSMVLGASLLAAPSGAQEAVVTLEAGKNVINFGKAVLLSGAITPESQGETVTIVDDEGEQVGEDTTNADGVFKVWLRPKYSARYTAMWLAAPSNSVRVRVRPKVSVSLRKVRLFDKAKIAGVVRPAQSKGKARVTLFRDGNKVFGRKVPLRKGKHFKLRFRVKKTGTYTARAAFTEPEGITGKEKSTPLSPPLPSLGPGARNVYVKLLEWRLRKLKYHLPGVDWEYDYRTSDAMRAFNKVQGRARLGTVDAATWRALATAKRAKARFKTDDFHFEIDQTRQILMTVRNGKVQRVIHVSTGAGNATRDGTFRVFRKIAGYSPGRLYYPSYWDGLRAFHGWPEVPTYNASHGCVRLPMWTAKWVYRKAPIGSVVRIYH